MNMIMKRRSFVLMSKKNIRESNVGQNGDFFSTQRPGGERLFNRPVYTMQHALAASEKVIMKPSEVQTVWGRLWTSPEEVCLNTLAYLKFR